MGGQHSYYSVGRADAEQEVVVCCDPTDRNYVFLTADDPEAQIGRCPARHLTVENIVGLSPWPPGLSPQQLALPLLLEANGLLEAPPPEG